MSKLARTGISLEEELLARFDRVIRRAGYRNRSEAIRDLVRDYTVLEDVEKDRTVVGTLTMVYDHHRPGLAARLIEAQHHAAAKVLAATHVHLDPSNCLEVVIMKGRSSEVNHIAERILSLRGVKHGKVVLTTTGKGLD
ncbi:MAG: nickel-responsive transcriptional regulator NikR [Terriglobia bacterium]